MSEYFQTGSKLPGRGMSLASRHLIRAMYSIAEEAQPITGRGVGYKLFAAGLIPSMSTKEMAKVYRLLRIARERDDIPWPWIVDETRNLEKSASWRDPQEYIAAVKRSYRRDFWEHQPFRVEVWSEKGTIRGVLAPVLDEYGVGFRVNHGFSGATPVHDIAEDYDGRLLIAIYTGDFDPSGLCMSEHDLPNRLEKYGGDHVVINRVAVVAEDLDNLPTFKASEKRKDARYRWFVENYGDECAELDALDPNDLRARVEEAIKAEIEWEAWKRCSACQLAEQQSLTHVLEKWNPPPLDGG